ncbi:MAG: glycosyltransferase family 4 protein [Chthoniobacterales bacterium]
MRITLVVHALEPGGSTAFADQLTRSFRAAGDEVSVVAGAASSLSEAPRHEVVPAFRRRCDRAFAYRETVLRTKPDVVYALSGLEEFDMLRMVDIPRARHIFSLEKFLFTDIQWIIRRCSEWVELFTANTPDVLEAIGSASPSSQRCLAPYQIASDWFDVPQIQRDSRIVNICFVGRFERHQKRAHWLPAIVEGCENAGLSLCWNFFGAGELDGSIRRRIETTLPSGRVIFHGWVSQDQLRSRLSEIDLFLLCSRWEGLPIAMVEAMAAGVSPIAPDIPGGMRYAVGSEQAGWLYEASSPKQAIAQLVAIARNRPAIEIRRAAARRFAHSKFSPEVTSGQFAQLREALESLKFNGRALSPQAPRLPTASFTQRFAARLHGSTSLKRLLSL